MPQARLIELSGQVVQRLAGNSRVAQIIKIEVGIGALGSPVDPAKSPAV